MQSKHAIILIASAIGLTAAAFYAGRSISNTQKQSEEHFRQLSGQADTISSQLHEHMDQLSVPVTEATESLYPNAAYTESSLTESDLTGSDLTESENETMTETESMKPLEITQSMIRSARVIFVGDSRTVGMGYAEYDRGDHCFYIGKSGEGFRWFLDEGVEQLQDTLRENPGLPVIYNLGVNDTESINDYIDLYRTIEAEWNETAFYYLSVNPIDSDEFNVTNSDIRAFNRRIRAEFPDAYIDSYTWMKRAGFDTVDGIHYPEDQYCKIHDFAIRAVLESPRKR